MISFIQSKPLSLNSNQSYFKQYRELLMYTTPMDLMPRAWPFESSENLHLMLEKESLPKSDGLSKSLKQIPEILLIKSSETLAP